MNYLSDSYIVQVEATACLYEITRNSSASKMHPSIWSRVVEVTLDTMNRFRLRHKIQNNVLLVLSTDRILQVCISCFVKQFVILFIILINESSILSFYFYKLNNFYWFKKKYFMLLF